MKAIARTVVPALLVIAAIGAAQLPSATPVHAAGAATACPAYLNHDFRKLHSSQEVNLCKEFAGKPLLIVNTASHCGFTRQFTGLEAVHQKYKDRGLVVVGFASNDFNQEAKTEAEAAEICVQNFGVSFTMIAPQKVRGADANPVFAELAKQSKAPAWNFNKYLVTADGKVLQYLDSRAEPDSAEFAASIEKLLN